MGCGASTSANNQKGDDGKEKPQPTKEIKGDGISKMNFIGDNEGKKVTEFYQIEKKKLGEGSYGYVNKCVNKATKMTYAMKTIGKAQVKSQERFLQEIRIMKMMDHPNIIKLYESYSDAKNMYLVMELCTGGELFDRIIDSGHFTESQAACVMKNIFRAIYYMHEQHVVHRDLKPENFLFVSKEPIEKTNLKIIDFGLACLFTEGQVLSTKAGTPYYVAPQVLSGKYDEASDLWSCGVIMYVLLCGYPPFHGDTDADVLAKVRQGNFSFNATDWKNVSEDGKQLIRNLLKMNPKDRFTAKQALEHDWTAKQAPRAQNVPLQGNLVDNLKSFRSQNKLKKAALHVIASQLSESQIKGLRETFMDLDDDGDGLLTSKELKKGLESAGFKEIPPDLQQIMEAVDGDGSGTIDYTEFLAATLDKQMYMKEDILWAAFRVFDQDGNGKISKEEIATVLGDGDVKAIAVRDMAEIMQEIDQNGDGEIDFSEFQAMMLGVGGSKNAGLNSR